MSNNLPEPYGVLFQPAPEFDADVSEDETAAIRLLDPEYKGIVIRYNTISFNEIDDASQLSLKFDYKIISGKIPSKKKADFEITLGNLLYDIILQKISQE
jgi:hypothetical protein